MITLVLAATLQVASVDPADWDCAEPYIQRNHEQRVEAEQLALRISDECARSYVPRPTETDLDRHFESTERTTYLYRLIAFRAEIEARIQAERRRDTIRLD